ncbi:MAG: sigma-54-dependent Fis family transcriptional regulator, partial [Deltaproteobacteria bacterium]|nr:sigma-54-dependent Fis family transcriptional regulator [Deltaproteobacteria bacterium]
VAKLIHRLSLRSGERFVALNCAALPEPLIESELFGYQKGAFTGANTSKEGLFEASHGGTLFLDEIADMPLALQAKLLRVLQEREVRRLGDNESRKVDVRIIAATHQDLGQNVKEGKFRLDLLYRLEVVILSLAPLRERAEDVPLLADYFLKESCQRHGKVILEILPDVMQILLSYAWPGNVRELFNVIERAVVFCNQEKITKEFLPSHLLQISKEPLCLEKSQISIPLGISLEEVEKILIQKTLEATSGDKNLTAKLLGVHSRTIYRKLGLVNK